VSSDAVTLVRQEWEEGNRLLEAARDDGPRYRRLVDEVEILTGELRRRVGQTYTLAELAGAYRDGDRWARAALEEQASPGWAPNLALVLAASFYAYQRGAVDYAP
jgi:hypothetical protein